ncbi:hypothetical protein [Bacteroides congonensis]|uniref:hypothetical protein n=1 Tax=Bacteroides congonensis TaxID=1871006 RepID=UPI001899A9F3|nr:hypothetical protein [Bacteroides congonensis]
MKCSGNIGINARRSVYSLSPPYTKVKILFQPITTILKRPIHRTYRTVIGCRQPITSSITYHHPSKDNAGIQTKAHEQTEVSTGDNFSFKAGNHSFMQVKL